MGDTALMHEELQALGITPNYKGYQQAVCAIQLALEEESRLRNVTKEIYWVVADAMGCARSDIERNLRTLSLRAWRVNPLRLQEIAPYPLSAPPAASQRITILTTHIQRLRAWEAVQA